VVQSTNICLVLFRLQYQKDDKYKKDHPTDSGKMTLIIDIELFN